MMNLIKNLFKVAKLLSVDDSGDLRFATVSFLGKQQRVLMFAPYGLMHHPPASSMVPLWSQQAQESNGVGIADDPKNRPLKDLEEWEVAFGNYETGDYIYFTKDNGVIVKSATKVTVGAPEVTVLATDVEITSTTLTHNGTNVGDDHVHPQDLDSGGNTEQDTEGPQ